jgi:hypothetical protein
VTLAVLGSGSMFAYGQTAPISTRPPPSPYRLSGRLARRPTRRFRRCVLHIGTEKTGTTTLQAFLGLNQAALARGGAFVPVSLAPAAQTGAMNHLHLAAVAMEDGLPSDLRAYLGVDGPEATVAYRHRMFAALEAELTAAPSACDTLLLSNEHGHSRLFSIASIAHLKSFLDPFCDHYSIVVYLRAQHELAMSQYGMMLTKGMVNIDIFQPMPPPPDYPKAAYTSRPYFDYASLLRRWMHVFGAAALIPRLFDRTSLIGGTIISDFLAAAGIADAKFARPPNQNANISAAAQRFLIKLYTALDPASVPQATQDRAAELLRARYPGAGILPSRDQAEAFFGQFAACNEAVRAQWFPDRASLFAPDFARFPAVPTDQTLSDPETALLLADIFNKA